MDPSDDHANDKKSAEVCGDKRNSLHGEVKAAIGEYCWLILYRSYLID